MGHGTWGMGIQPTKGALPLQLNKKCGDYNDVDNDNDNDKDEDNDVGSAIATCAVFGLTVPWRTGHRDMELCGTTSCVSIRHKLPLLLLLRECRIGRGVKKGLPFLWQRLFYAPVGVFAWLAGSLFSVSF